MWLNNKYWLIKDDSKADFRLTTFRIWTLPKSSFETTEVYPAFRLFWRTANPKAQLSNARNVNIYHTDSSKVSLNHFGENVI